MVLFILITWWLDSVQNCGEKSVIDRSVYSPICWSTLGSIILAICWLSLAICDGFTFLLMSPPEAWQNRAGEGCESFSRSKTTAIHTYRQTNRFLTHRGSKHWWTCEKNFDLYTPHWSEYCWIMKNKHKWHKCTKTKGIPLKRPFIPPIFFTIAANLVYCDSSSWTSRTDTPQPRATRVERPGWRENSFAPLGLSSSKNIKNCVNYRLVADLS